MGRDLHHLLRDTAAGPQRPVDPAHIEAVARRRTWRNRTVAGVAVAAVAVGLAVVVPGLVGEPLAPEIVNQPDASMSTWKTVEVDEAAFSVPGDWPVSRNLQDRPASPCVTRPTQLVQGCIRVYVADPLGQPPCPSAASPHNGRGGAGTRHGPADHRRTHRQFRADDPLSQASAEVSDHDGMRETATWTTSWAASTRPTARHSSQSLAAHTRPTAPDDDVEDDVWNDENPR